ncbi:MAG TPA: type II toxin-antitoxin system Phd/YefM family antitoxin [Verrucomicrobiaceae bacterium]
MTKVPLHLAKDSLSSLLRKAAKQRIIITRHGRPAGVLIGFADEEDYFDYQLENDPRFEQRIARSRAQKLAGKVTRLEDVAP